MKKIPYVSRVTNSNANYKKTLTSDTNWVLEQCKQLVQVAGLGVIEVAALNTKNPNIPKQSSGRPNTPKSMCEGVIDNFNNSQYDLTDKTMQGVQEAFRIGADIINDFEEVDFHEVDKLPKIPKPIIEVDSIPNNSMYEDLFEIVINVRKK